MRSCLSITFTNKKISTTCLSRLRLFNVVDGRFDIERNVSRGMSSAIKLESYLSNRPENTDGWPSEHDIWRDLCIIFVPEYLQPAGFSYGSVMDRRRRSYQKAGISANTYLEKQKFPCPTCSSVFSHKNNLYYHCKFECGQLPRFNCPYCVYRTKHVSNVRAHVRRKHPGNNVYAIDVCKILER